VFVINRQNKTGRWENSEQSRRMLLLYNWNPVNSIISRKIDWNLV